jgi:hypothetical protein
MARIQHWAYCDHCKGDGCRWCGNTGEVITYCDPNDTESESR